MAAKGIFNESELAFFDKLAEFLQVQSDVADTSAGLAVLLSMLSASLMAAEALVAGDFVHVFADSGVAKVQKANATDTTKPADGFVLAAVAPGALAKVYGPGQVNTALSGLTPGSKYWLSTTGGAAASAAPAASGNGDQEIGKALSANALLFAPKLMVEAP